MFLPSHLYTGSGSDQKSTGSDRLRNTAPEGYFGLSLLLLGPKLLSAFFLELVEPGFAVCATFFLTSKADHLAVTSCADRKNLSSSQACALNFRISSMKSARTVSLSE